MNAQERLYAGQLAAIDGKHEEALKHFVWFHDHSLEVEPALYGVRLSFALSYWKDLGESYPKALRALRRKRDEKSRFLLGGIGDRRMFHDVEAINDTCGELKKTHVLFVRLAQLNPELARNCAALALPAVVAAGDFRLANSLAPDPIGRIRRLCSELDTSIERQRSKPRRVQIASRRALVHNHVQDVQLPLSILKACGRADEASEGERRASALLGSPSVRKAVRARLATSQ